MALRLVAGASAGSAALHNYNMYIYDEARWHQLPRYPDNYGAFQARSLDNYGAFHRNNTLDRPWIIRTSRPSAMFL